VSRCLLGDRVRYDGEIKYEPVLLDFIQQHFEIIGVCPEVEIGLSTPRPPLQLGGSLQAIKMTGRDDPSIDITEAMQNYCNQRPPQLNSICAYIFKSRSPSCGIKDIPLFNSQGEILQTIQGVFAHAIIQQYPELPISDENGLASRQQKNIFLDKVNAYHTLKMRQLLE